MQLEQIYTGCLAQGAYYVTSGKDAIIIDPLRETQPYLERLQRDGVSLKYIFETHFHADFVSGHVDLAKATGATIVYGPTTMKTGFDFVTGTDGQLFKFGNATIKLIHTPGHTMESSCFLLMDEAGTEKALFSGDTLFIGDVGRPDLAQHVIADLTQEKLAGNLYDSLRNKILPLSDALIVYPGHGAGSACGKNMSKETSDTLGHQKKTNYALREGLTKEKFIAEVLDGLMPPPGYFPKNVLMNITGYDSINEVLHRGLHALSPKEYEAVHSSRNALIIDTREASEFYKGFIPGAVNIGIKGSFAVWAGTLIKDINQELLIVAEVGREEEIVTRLARVGYDHAIGFLKGGMNAWIDAGLPVDSIDAISVEEFAAIKADNPEINILDVRKESEYKSEHIVGAINMPLDYHEKFIGNIDPSKTYYVHCAGGYRAMAFVSIMKGKGFTNLIDVNGNFNDIKDTGAFQVTEYVCPTTML